MYPGTHSAVNRMSMPMDTGYSQHHRRPVVINPTSNEHTNTDVWLINSSALIGTCQPPPTMMNACTACSCAPCSFHACHSNSTGHGHTHMETPAKFSLYDQCCAWLNVMRTRAHGQMKQASCHLHVLKPIDHQGPSTHILHDAVMISPPCAFFHVVKQAEQKHLQ